MPSNDIPAFSNIKLMQTPSDDNHAARLVDIDNKISALNVGTISTNLSTHIADTSVHVPTQNSAGYVFLSNTSTTSSGTWTAYTSSVTQNSSALVTSGAVWSAINALATVYAPATHTHATSDVTSGVFNSDRIPTATGSVKGGVIVGDGITVVTGVISVNTGNGLEIDSTSKAVNIKLDTNSGLSVSSNGLKIDTTNIASVLGLGTAAFVDTGTATGNVPTLQGTSATLSADVLPKANGAMNYGVVALASSNPGLNLSTGALSVKAGNGIQVGSGGVAIKLLSTNSGLTVTANGLSVDTSSLASLLNLGTASTATLGTSANNVPQLDQNGKLPTSVIPAVAITDTFVVATTTEMTALTDADVGDVCIVTGESKSYILAESGASVANHWQELLSPTDAVTSVNGVTGDVVITLSGLGGMPLSYLETTLSTSNNSKVPSSKAVADFIASNCVLQSDVETTLTTSSTTKIPCSNAVYTYVSTNYATKTHNHSASDINSGTLASARLPTAGASSKGCITINGNGLKLVTGTSTIAIDFLAPSSGVYDTTDDTKAITAKAAKAIADSAVASAAKGFAGSVTCDGTATSFDVTHSLGTTNVIVQIYNSDGVPCLVSYTRDTNKITLNFDSAPAQNTTFSVMIIAIV